ncbi:unnamed protein product [Symbiodinium pilosum]|uniref:Uncharacterized protein n=1 Tax=Symbiodinium pilosum TaxID=2952 RepID=A0A812MMY1_SYMPI|nr:unnamed protein product [Symbiodinium pilosum]
MVTTASFATSVLLQLSKRANDASSAMRAGRRPAASLLQAHKWKFSKTRAALLGSPLLKTLVFWVYIGVPVVLETAKHRSAKVWIT